MPPKPYDLIVFKEPGQYSTTQTFQCSSKIQAIRALDVIWDVIGPDGAGGRDGFVYFNHGKGVSVLSLKDVDRVTVVPHEAKP